MTTHADLHVVLAETEALAAAPETDLGHADAGGMSLAAERERREIAEEADWITRRMLEGRVR